MLVGVCGDIGAGKTTLLRMVAGMAGHEFAKEVNLADPLKYACTAAFNVNPWFLYTSEGKVAPLPMPRHAVGANSVPSMRVFARACVNSMNERDLVAAFGDYNKFNEDLAKRGVSVLGEEFGFEQDRRMALMAETDPLALKHYEYIVPTTGRRLLQLMGTEVGRHVDNDMWVKIAMWKSELVIKQGARLVLWGDVRFDNEYLAIKRAGGKVIRVVREKQRALYGHISEGTHWSWEVDREMLNLYGTDVLKVDAEQLTRDLLARS